MARLINGNGSVTLVATLLIASMANGAPLSFNEVRDRVYAQPLQQLPHYSNFSIPAAIGALSGMKTLIMERARLTTSDPSDFKTKAPKVLHPMGVCASGTWTIDGSSAATGLLSRGTQVPIIARLSVASDQVLSKKGASRVIAIAVKLFPTSDKNQKVRTRNYLTTDQAGLDGSDRPSFFFGRNDQEKVAFSNRARGEGFASKLGFLLFDRVDSPSNFRSLYQLAEIDSSGRDVADPRTPVELKAIPRMRQTTVPDEGYDFRSEILQYHAGEIQYDLALPLQPGVSSETRIGHMVLDEPVISEACDQELTFEHHPSHRALDGSANGKMDTQLDGNIRTDNLRYINGPTPNEPGDGWQFQKGLGHLNPLFSEFKYFNFQQPDFTGAITYSVISPMLTKQVQMNAHFVYQGQMIVVRKVFDAKCVAVSSDDMTANFCDEGSVQVLGPGKLRVTQNTGPVNWDLTYDAADIERTREFTHIDFSETLPGALNRLVKGWFSWVPVFRNAAVTGHVAIKGASGQSSKLINVSSHTSYHDQNWEVWNPQAQPFRWLHFTATDSQGEHVDLLLGDFPKNSDQGAGLSIYRNGVRKYYAPGTYVIKSTALGHIPVTRIAPKETESLQTQTIDFSFRTGEHTIATRAVITTNDGAVSADVVTTSAVSTETTKPSKPGVSLNDGKFLLDEQNVTIKLRFKSSTGEARTAEGPGEYMETSTNR